MLIQRDRRQGKRPSLSRACPLLSAITGGWCAWTDSRRKTDAIESGSVRGGVSDVCADSANRGDNAERERAAACCRGGPGEHGRTSRGRGVASAYKPLDPGRAETRRRKLSFGRDSGVTARGVQPAVYGRRRGNSDRGCVRLSYGGE